MRMMMTVQVDNEAGNRALKDGTLQTVIGKFTTQFKPEASYFTVNDGSRTAYFVFDLTDASQMPVAAEPFFMTLNAKIDCRPVMTAEDLGRGVAALSKSL